MEKLGGVREAVKLNQDQRPGRGARKVAGARGRVAYHTQGNRLGRGPEFPPPSLHATRRAGLTPTLAPVLLTRGIFVSRDQAQRERPRRRSTAAEGEQVRGRSRRCSAFDIGVSPTGFWSPGRHGVCMVRLGPGRPAMDEFDAAEDGGREVM